HRSPTRVTSCATRHGDGDAGRTPAGTLVIVVSVRAARQTVADAVRDQALVAATTLVAIHAAPAGLRRRGCSAGGVADALQRAVAREGGGRRPRGRPPHPGVTGPR